MRYPISQLWRGTYRLYRWPLLFALVIFCLSIILGVVLPLSIKLTLLDAIGTKFADIINSASTPWHLTWNIFTNNLLVAIILFISGFTVVLPAFVVVGNGLIIGVVLGLFYRIDAFMPGEFLRAVITLIPHGIFELSAFFISAVLSVMVVIKVIFNKQIEPHKLRRMVFLDAILRLVGVIVPLLLVAALCEVFVSGNVADWVVGELSNPITTTNLVSINATALAKHDCQPTTANSTTARTLGATLTDTAKIVYDDDIYSLLQQRQSIPKQELNYDCADGGSISIMAWPTQDWAVSQAMTLESKVLDATNTSYTVTEKSTYKLPHQLIEFTTIGESTVVASFSRTKLRLSDLTE